MVLGEMQQDSVEQREIRIRRSELALLYIHRVNYALTKINKEHVSYEKFKNAKNVLLGKVTNVNLRMLSGLKSFLSTHFPLPTPKQTTTINLVSSSDEEDEEQHHPQFSSDHSFPPNSPLEAPVIDTQPAEPDDVIIELEDVTQLPLDTSNYVQHLPLSVQSIPKPSQALPSITSLNSDLDVTRNHNVPAEVPLTTLPTRRKSISSLPRPVLPSIAVYKIKHKPPKSSAVYAKPKDVQNAQRKIISVPYKKQPHVTQTPYDPIEEAQKLKSIKEKIYEKNYLKIDAEHKDDMIEEYRKRKEAEEAAARAAESESSVEDESEEDYFQPAVSKITKPRRKSVVERPKKSDVLVRKGRARKRKCIEKKAPKRVARSKSRTRPLSEDEDEADTDYHVPDHVYDNIDEDLANLFGASSASNKESQFTQKDTANDVQSPSESEQSEDIDTVAKTSTSVVHRPRDDKISKPSLNSKPAAVTFNISNARMTRSKSILIELAAKMNASEQCTNDEEDDNITVRDMWKDPIDDQNLMRELPMNRKIKRPYRKDRLVPRKKSICEPTELINIKQEPMLESEK